MDDNSSFLKKIHRGDWTVKGVLRDARKLLSLTPRLSQSTMMWNQSKILIQFGNKIITYSQLEALKVRNTVLSVGVKEKVTGSLGNLNLLFSWQSARWIIRKSWHFVLTQTVCKIKRVTPPGGMNIVSKWKFLKYRAVFCIEYPPQQTHPCPYGP